MYLVHSGCTILTKLQLLYLLVFLKVGGFLGIEMKTGLLGWKMEERRGGGRTRAARADYQLIYFKNAQLHIVAQGLAAIQRLLTHGSPFPRSVFTTCQRTRGKSSHTVSTGPAAASGRLFLSTLCCAEPAVMR